MNGATYQNNTAQGGNGGAIYTSDPTTIISSMFDNNKAIAAGGMGGFGGAVYSSASGTQTTVKTSYFLSNNASKNGGAIDSYNDTALRSDTFAGNSAGEDGGAIANELEDTLSITDSGFWGNNAGEDGGAVANFGTLNVALVNGVNGTYWNYDKLPFRNNYMFVGNVAQTNGGAINSNALSEENAGGLNITSSFTSRIDFLSNQAVDGSGGAVFTADDTTISNARFGRLIENVGTGGAGKTLQVFGNTAGVSGGAINAAVGVNSETGSANPIGLQTLGVTNSIFSANKVVGAVGMGGAIFTSANTDVELSTFGSNENSDIMGKDGLGSQVGGAIAYVIPTGAPLAGNLTLTVNLDYFEQNHAFRGGGIFTTSAIATNQLTMKVTDSTFYQNYASSTGGGVDLEAAVDGTASASTTLLNDTFFQNSAISGSQSGAGGGIFINLTVAPGTAAPNTASLTSLTVYENSTDGNGGGLAVESGTVSIYNSILSENTTTQPTGFYDVFLGGGASMNDLGYTLVDTGIFNASVFKQKTDILIAGSPGLANTLAPNGAPVGYPPTLALSTTSPGYEMGALTLQGSTDERGYIRGDPTSIGAEDPDAAPPS